MLVVILLAVGLYAASIVLGAVLIRKIVQPQENIWLRSMGFALVRSLFYTPTLALGGHGAMPMPAVLALLLTEPRHLLFASVTPAMVFIVSLLASFFAFRLSHAGDGSLTQDSRQKRTNTIKFAVVMLMPLWLPLFVYMSGIGGDKLIEIHRIRWHIPSLLPVPLSLILWIALSARRFSVFKLLRNLFYCMCIAGISQFLLLLLYA